MIVTKLELEHYFSKLQQNNEILRFWKKLLKKLPKNLLDEIRQKPTNLIHMDKGNYELVGHKTYVFVTQNGSQELNAFLKDHIVYVDEGSNEVYKSENDVNEKLQAKNPVGRK
jgi:hypothetical protein